MRRAPHHLAPSRIRGRATSTPPSPFGAPTALHFTASHSLTRTHLARRDADLPPPRELGGVAQQVVQDLHSKGTTTQAAFTMRRCGDRTSCFAPSLAPSLATLQDSTPLPSTSPTSSCSACPSASPSSHLHDAARVSHHHHARRHQVNQRHLAVHQAAGQVQHVVHHVPQHHLPDSSRCAPRDTRERAVPTCWHRTSDRWQGRPTHPGDRQGGLCMG